MTRSKHVTLWMGLHRWKLVCAAIIATAAAIGVTAGPCLKWMSKKEETDTKQSAQIDANSDAIVAIREKLDRVANDTSEIKGSVNTLLRLMQSRTAPTRDTDGVARR